MFHSGPQTVLGEQNVPGAAGNLQGMVAGNPFGQQFVIQQRGIRGMTPGQLEELKQWDPGSMQQLQNIYDNRKPGGPQLPLAYSNGSVPMGNAGAVAILNQGMYSGPQYGQQLPSNIVKTVY
jgi:hypothetical protein